MYSSLQAEIQALLDTAVAEGRERGAQLALYHHGKLVMDVVAGFTDATETTRITPETVFPVFSVSKGITTTLIHRLIAQGYFGLDQTIASVWPEFGAEGKGEITVRNALAHTAGLANLPPGITPEEVADWDHMCGVVERLRPDHAPGEAAAYHALTFGWILGGLAERATGKSFGELLAQEICDPLQLKALFIGMPETAGNPVAVLESRIPETAPAPLSPLPVPVSLQPLHELMNKPLLQRACLPGASGLMAARDIARHYAATLPGGVDGVELLTEAQRTAALDFQDGMQPGGWVCGYQRLDGQTQGPTRFYGHSGHGGSKAWAHLDKQLSCAYTHNALQPNDGTEAAWPGIFELILKRID